MARWCDQASPTTFLQGDFGIPTDDAGPCPLRRIRLPHSPWWHQIPRPGGYIHITLEEFDARNWSIECALLRPGEVGGRLLRAGDKAAAVGAAIKGRFGRRPLSGRCRRAAALEIAGGLCIFDFWVRSATTQPTLRAVCSAFGLKNNNGEQLLKLWCRPRCDSHHGVKSYWYAAKAPILTLGFHHTLRP